MKYIIVIKELGNYFQLKFKLHETFDKEKKNISNSLTLNQSVRPSMINHVTQRTCNNNIAIWPLDR